MKQTQISWHGHLFRKRRVGESALLPTACVAAAVLGGSLLLAASASTAPSDKPIPFDGSIVQTAGPVAYYTNSCARCHGSVEIAYGAVPTLKRNAALRQSIKDMADGPAQSSLSDPDLQKQYDLHLAVIDHGPYVWIDDATKDVVAGETMPDSTVELRTADGVIKAKMDQYNFVLPRKAGTLVVTRNDLKNVPQTIRIEIKAR